MFALSVDVDSSPVVVGLLLVLVQETVAVAFVVALVGHSVLIVVASSSDVVEVVVANSMAFSGTVVVNYFPEQPLV